MKKGFFDIFIIVIEKYYRKNIVIMMLLSLSDYYSQSQKNFFKANMCISVR